MTAPRPPLPLHRVADRRVVERATAVLLGPPRDGGDWTLQASCRDTDPDELFVQGAAQNKAKMLCFTCPVRAECLADALDNRVEFGVWGGMTERERRALLRRRPDVTSWSRLLRSPGGEAALRPPRTVRAAEATGLSA